MPHCLFSTCILQALFPCACSTVSYRILLPLDLAFLIEYWGGFHIWRPNRRGRGFKKDGKFADKQYRFWGKRGGRGSKDLKKCWRHIWKPPDSATLLSLPMSIEGWFKERLKACRRSRWSGTGDRCVSQSICFPFPNSSFFLFLPDRPCDAIDWTAFSFLRMIAANRGGQI